VKLLPKGGVEEVVERLHHPKPKIKTRT